MDIMGYLINKSIDSIKNRPIDLFLLITAITLTVFSSTTFLKERTDVPQQVESVPIVLSADTEKPLDKTITVEVAGAVKNPDIFEVSEGARLKDVIQLADGFSKDAALDFISRNFNMAKFVTDQEKIYIPSEKDIKNGTFKEDPKILDYLLGSNNDGSSMNNSSVTDQLLISINEAGSTDLETLPGIGPTTAQKIVDNRPYARIDELLSKKAVNNSTYEKIKDLVKL